MNRKMKVLVKDYILEIAHQFGIKEKFLKQIEKLEYALYQINLILVMW